MAARPDPRPTRRVAASVAGDPLATRAAAEEGRDLAEAIGDRFGLALLPLVPRSGGGYQGDLVGAAAQFGELVAEAQAAHDGILEAASLRVPGRRAGVPGWASGLGCGRRAAAELGGLYAGTGYVALAIAALAAGDVATLRDATEAGPHLSALPQTGGDAASRQWRRPLCWAGIWLRLAAGLTRRS